MITIGSKTAMSTNTIDLKDTYRTRRATPADAKTATGYWARIEEAWGILSKANRPIKAVVAIPSEPVRILLKPNNLFDSTSKGLLVV